MKVIQVYQTDLLKDEQGGGIRYVKNLTYGIKKYVNKILFLGIGNKKENIENIEIIPITKKMTGYVKFLWNLSWKLPFINTKDYKVVHVHRAYFAIPFIIFKPHLKVVCTLHGRTFTVFESNFGSTKLKLVKPFFMAIEKFALKHIDFLVPVSEDVFDHFYQKYPQLMKEKESNTEILGSMLDLSDFKVKKSNYLQKKYGYENIYILFLGRLADVKDIEFLIKMFCKKFSYKDYIKLIIAGRGEKEKDLKELAKEICQKNPPIFLGEVKPKDVPDLIASSDLVILTSKHEASPTVVKEALSSGVPVITNNTGDVKQFIINGKNGFMVNKNYEDYFEAIMKIIDNPEIFSKKNIYEISKKKLNECSIDYISQKYIEIYKKVIK